MPSNPVPNLEEQPDVCFMLTTCATEEQASELAQGLIDQALAACVNIIPNIQSWYRWQEEICNTTELKLIIKCRTSQSNAVYHWLLLHHPYEVPEILVIPVSAGHHSYINWMKTVC